MTLVTGELGCGIDADFLFPQSGICDLHAAFFDVFKDAHPIRDFELFLQAVGIDANLLGYFRHVQ